MQSFNRGPGAAAPEAQLRLLRILWAVFLVSVGLYALLGHFTAPLDGAERRELGLGAPGWLLPAFVLLGVALVLASLAVKRAYAHKAAAERRPDLFQTGLMVALVLCEAAALFGMAALFLTGDRYAFVLFGVGAAGMLLHFPSRGRLDAASGRGPGR